MSGVLRYPRGHQRYLVHAEKMESGATRYWVDPTFRNVMERWAWENQKQE